MYVLECDNCKSVMAINKILHATVMTYEGKVYNHLHLCNVCYSNIIGDIIMLPHGHSLDPKSDTIFTSRVLHKKGDKLERIQ